MKKFFGFLLAICLVAMLVVTPIGVAAETTSSQPGEDVDIDLGEGTPGDLDDSGSVNLNDLVLLAQYVANWPVTVNKYAADVDGVAGIELTDVTRLAKYLAGWNVELGVA